MRIREDIGEEEAPATLLPLIDMVFLLLIFFLVATTIAQEERDLAVQLPVTSTAQPLSAPPQQFIINVMEDGSTKVAGRIVDEAELRTMLRHVAENESTREVLIRADERGVVRHFARVLSRCREAGIHEAKIGYIFGAPGP